MWLSNKGYARHRGVSPASVREALQAGRITRTKKGIDPVLADQQWAVSTNLSKPRNSVIGVPKKRRAPGAPSDPLGVESSENGDAGRLVSSYAASRAAREAFLARLAKLDYEQRSGKMVDADKVRAQFFAEGRRLRDAVMRVPVQLAAALAAASDPSECRKLMETELTRALAEQGNGK